MGWSLKWYMFLQCPLQVRLIHTIHSIHWVKLNFNSAHTQIFSDFFFFYLHQKENHNKTILHKYALVIQECHWKASASWTRPSEFPASGLFCVQSGREQIWPTRDEQTDLPSAGFHLELRRGGETGTEVMNREVSHRESGILRENVCHYYLVPVRYFASDRLKSCSTQLRVPGCPTWSRPSGRTDPETTKSVIRKENDH